MSEHPEAQMYNQLAEDMNFHESKKFSSDDRKVVLVDVDETICFKPACDLVVDDKSKRIEEL